ncbi:MAG TPA: hypothetical protein VGZ29_04725 [Terriglobia bacterium]|nr:hypothetical protein [Terriglobia bacterium]
MEYYELLTSETLVIAALAATLWLRTRNVSIMLGIGVLYYWSLYGAWSLVDDMLGGSSGRLYGYLEAKMFAINLDGYYFETLVYYGLFIVVVELTLLFLARPGSPPRTLGQPLYLSHLCILLFAASAGFLSYLLIRPYLGEALQLGLSGYKATRDSSPYFSIHQVLNRAALIIVALGFATRCSGEKPRLLEGDRHPWTLPAYLVVIAGLYGFNFVLGNKNEPLNAGLAGGLLYLYNRRRPRLLPVAVTATAGMCGLWLIDHFRAYPLSQITGQFRNLDFSSLLGDSYGLVNSSNECFAAHFSLYGVLAYHITPVLGRSFVSLAASMVPHLLWKSRPADIYTYYVSSVGAVGGQGYTIHHATGWYLNFGAAGVPLGALVLGSAWSACLNAHRNRMRAASRWGLAFRSLAPCLFAAFLPNMVRAGIEGYKSLLLEGLLIPITVLAMAGWRMKKLTPRAAAARLAPGSDGHGLTHRPAPGRSTLGQRPGLQTP